MCDHEIGTGRSTYIRGNDSEGDAISYDILCDNCGHVIRHFYTIPWAMLPREFDPDEVGVTTSQNGSW